MDWITGLQRAIDYVEDHLTEELDYMEIAVQAASSSFHFQRVFGILCGCTLGEYIRNRRLTLAGGELAATDMKVLDAQGCEIELKDEDEDTYQPVRDDYYDREDSFGYQAGDDFAAAGGFTFKGDSDDADLALAAAEEGSEDALFAEDDYN